MLDISGLTHEQRKIIKLMVETMAKQNMTIHEEPRADQESNQKNNETQKMTINKPHSYKPHN